jgi:Membrane protease subunits, stomatin/prohibitin homologs
MKERKAWKLNGFVALLLAVVLVAGGLFVLASSGSDAPHPSAILAAVVMMLGAVIIVTSLVIVHPNEAKVLTFFGRYVGTLHESGFWMTVPFSSRKKISLRVRNFNSQRLKVNDAEGNPIEIGAVIVFRVVDTAKASFDVDNYEEFVEIQSETAIRHIATQYAYDTFSEEPGVSLRSNTDEIAEQLMRELQARLEVAGVKILETRLSHLAYAPEIANAMLQRQQAMAIVASRQKVVEGAVGMVDMALRKLVENGIELDDERRAAMVNNLMVAIVSDRSATPVINTGTLYS